jgi:hypothetical protein
MKNPQTQYLTISQLQAYTVLSETHSPYSNHTRRPIFSKASEKYGLAAIFRDQDLCNTPEKLQSHSRKQTRIKSDSVAGLIRTPYRTDL